jgi:N-acetylmuramate 1-kinase
MTILWSSIERQIQFENWFKSLSAEWGFQETTVCLASSDASFRRYLRVQGRSGPLIVMDAPPEHENVALFVDVAQRLAHAGLQVPNVLASHLQHGFLLLSDFGSNLALEVLQDKKHPDASTQSAKIMTQAIQALVLMQSRASVNELSLYDEGMLRRELSLFPEWCVQKEYGTVWDENDTSKWNQICELLIHNAISQPQVFVHRDYMPRNWMVTSEGLGILDFQDAVRGPISYDLASMTRDAFFSWEEDEEIDWAVRYWQAAKKAGLPVLEDFGEFWRQMEWMGLQRHLKVLGIFCRLKHRDNKPKYSQDLPRFFNYVHRVARRYNGFGPLVHLIEPLMGVHRVDAFY